MIDGAETTTPTNPSPSVSRASSSWTPEVAVAPHTEPAQSMSRLAKMTRRWPRRSAKIPTSMPSAMDVALKIDTIQPAVTRSRPSSPRIIGKAAGSLPIWPAAIMPALNATRMISQRVFVWAETAAASPDIPQASGEPTDDRIAGPRCGVGRKRPPQGSVPGAPALAVPTSLRAGPSHGGNRSFDSAIRPVIALSLFFLARTGSARYRQSDGRGKHAISHIARP